MHRLLWKIVIVAIMVAATTVPAEAASTKVEGGWIGPVPCLFTSIDPLTGQFSCQSSSSWDGALTGVTFYSGEGTLDLTTGDASGTIKETFHGVATADGSTGTLELIEKFTLNGATNAIHIDARIVGGTGDFADSHGRLTFVGVQLSGVAGHGGYHGTWVRP